MHPNNDVSFHEEMKPFCPSCGSGKISANKDEPPFYGDKENKYLIVPFYCDKCTNSFSVNVRFEPSGVIIE